MSKFIKKLRKAKGWTQTRLSKESGVSQTYISELEAGKSCPSLPVVIKLATALNVKMVDLIEDWTSAQETASR